MSETKNNLNSKLADITSLAEVARICDDEGMKRLAIGDIYHAIAGILPTGCVPPGADGTEPAGRVPRKTTLDFGRWHVMRAAIPGRVVLTFWRKTEHLPESGSVVPGRIIVAKLFKADVGAEKLSNEFVVKSYEPGLKPRVLYYGGSYVSMSKTEKMVYKMVKTDVEETARRCERRKAKRNVAALSPSAELAATVARQNGCEDLAERMENA